MDITPEHIYLRRRELLARLGFQGMALALGAPALAAVWGKKNSLYQVPDRALTDEKLALSYNNFYEFSLKKNEVQKLAAKWTWKEPWKIKVHGLCKKPQTFTVEELSKKLTLEERIYRFRCVEAWSMVVPWNGFPLSALLDLVEVKTEAKFVKFVSHMDPKQMPGIKDLPYYPWPYTEALRLDEAQHPLTFIATGLYGKALAKQNGAPVRLVVPWKYGFKSAKSLVEIELTADQPKTLWNQTAPKEYGFYANVNPHVDHPRWTQSKETVLDGKFFPTKIPTLMFNGYEKEVAGLYKGLDLKVHY